MWVKNDLVRGFTMIEMMTVLSVLTVLVLLAAPAFSELSASQRVQTAAEDIFTSLLRARGEAIKQNTDVTVAPAGSPAAWINGWKVSVGGTDVATHGATSSVAISGPGTAVTYRNSGRLSGTTTPKFSFSASATATKRCVQVNLNGQPFVTRSTCP